MKVLLKRCWLEEEGPDLLEYSLLLAFIRASGRVGVDFGAKQHQHGLVIH